MSVSKASLVVMVGETASLLVSAASGSSVSASELTRPIPKIGVSTPESNETTAPGQIDVFQESIIIRGSFGLPATREDLERILLHQGLDPIPNS